MNRFKYHDKYQRMVDLSIPSIENRKKFKSVQAYQKAMLRAKKYVMNYNNTERALSSESLAAWKYYNYARRYNTFMFFSLLWKIFAVLTPLIIVSVILSGDNFKFDFFQFTNRFADLNINFSKPLLDLLKASKKSLNEYAWNATNSGFEGFVTNFINMIRSIGVRIGQFLTILGLFFTFIFDFFSNVFAFLGALIPSLSY